MSNGGPKDEPGQGGTKRQPGPREAPTNWSSIPRADELAEVRSHELDTTRAHSARMWNYWLGGKDHYPADREAGERYAAQYPQIVDVARQSRAFLGRAVRFLAGECGVRQFLDIGTGLPTVDNTHEVAQRVDPACRIVYVDNDPLVLAHARALLNSKPEGACTYIDADLRDPSHILHAASKTLDFTQPVALMLLGILGHVTDDHEVHAIVRTLLEAVPAGSFLVVNDGTNTSTARVEATQQHNERGSAVYKLRSPEEIAGFLTGLELVEPGVVPTSLWRLELASPFGLPAAVDAYCGVGRKA